MPMRPKGQENSTWPQESERVCWTHSVRTGRSLGVGGCSCRRASGPSRVVRRRFAPLLCHKRLEVVDSALDVRN